MRPLKDYIGIPFKDKGRDRSGADCWGLFRIFYQEQFGIELPSHADDYENTQEGKTIGGLIIKDIEEKWTAIEQGQEKFGDGILIRLMNEPMHVGVITSPGWFLHCIEGADSVHETYRSAIWEKRILGIYRLNELCKQP